MEFNFLSRNSTLTVKVPDLSWFRLAAITCRRSICNSSPARCSAWPPSDFPGNPISRFPIFVADKRSFWRCSSVMTGYYCCRFLTLGGDGFVLSREDFHMISPHLALTLIGDTRTVVWLNSVEIALFRRFPFLLCLRRLHFQFCIRLSWKLMYYRRGLRLERKRPRKKGY